MEKHFPSDRLSDRAIRRFLRAPSARVLVAQDARQLLGNLVLLTRRGSRVARVYSLVVDHPGRGRGIAKRLVGEAEAAARAAGCEAISLEVREDNTAARSLYRRLGYAETARLAGFYDD